MNDELVNQYSILANTGFKIITEDGKQRYAIIKNGKTLKQSINKAKLVNWFTKEYPKEILILNK